METPQKEYKQFSLLSFKDAGTKTLAAQEFGTFSGYASTWTKDSYGDVIAPGAFAQSLVDERGQYPILFNHDSDNWIGFTTAVSEDKKGLAMEAGLALKSSQGADVYALLKAAAAVDFRVGLSIGFFATEVDWDGDTRVLKTIDLVEVSVTPFPANKRAFVDDVKSIRQFERQLRDVCGLTGLESKRFLSLLAALQPLAPARDVREMQTSQTGPSEAFMENLWQKLTAHYPRLNNS